HDKLDDGWARQKAEPRDAVALPKKCPSCAFLKPPKVLECPACGFAPAPKCDVVNRDGELVELVNRKTAIAVDQDNRTRVYQELKGHAKYRGYKPGWVGFQFKAKFGDWPDGFDHPPGIPPSRSTINWIRSSQIAFALRSQRSAS